MANLFSRFGVFSLAISAALFCSAADAASKKKPKTFTPGKARWEIKTTIPANAKISQAKQVDLKTVLTIKPPPGAKGHSRLMDHKRYPRTANAFGLAEGDIISVRGWIHLIAAEEDGDYHIQIAQTQNSQARCFIVEVPRPAQRFVKDARVRKAAAVVRKAIQSRALSGKDLKLGAARSLKSPVFAKVTGQFFYDDWHIGDKPRGKKGCKSPTVTEVHPVMRIVFPQ